MQNRAIWRRSVFSRDFTAGLARSQGAACCLIGLVLYGSTAAAVSAPVDSAKAESPHAAGALVDGKRLIGATAVVVECESGIPFLARVDTGAESTSIHVDDWKIKDESPERKKNIGKTIRFLIHNGADGHAWLTGKIAGTVRVKTSEKHESRYKVAVRLRVGEFEKECLVTINNRSHMTYPALLGRNFLHSDFLVDVSLDEAVEAEEEEEEEEPAAANTGKSAATKPAVAKQDKPSEAP